MKRTPLGNVFALLLCPIFFVALFISCGGEKNQPTKKAFALKVATHKMHIRQEVQIEVEGVQNDDLSQIFWESSDPNIVMVSPAGLAVAKSDGNATITATYKDETASVSFVVKTVSVDTDGKLYDLNVEQFKKLVWNFDEDPNKVSYLGNKPAIVFFTAVWCGHCQEIKPFVADLAAKYKDKAYVFLVDTDYKDSSGQNISIINALKSIYPKKFETIPTFLLLSANGRPAEVVKGSNSTTQRVLENFFETNAK